VSLKNAFGREVLSIDKDGSFERKASVYLELNEDNKSNYLSLYILSEDNVVAEVILSFNDAAININR